MVVMESIQPSALNVADLRRQECRGDGDQGEYSFLIFIPIMDKFRVDPKSDLLAGERPVLAVLRPFLSSQSQPALGGTTFEGSLKTFLRDLDEVGE